MSKCQNLFQEFFDPHGGQTPLLGETIHVIPDTPSGDPADVLRLSCRTLAEHPHHQPDRVDLRHHPASHAPDAGMPDPDRHAAHDLPTGAVR